MSPLQWMVINELKLHQSALARLHDPLHFKSTDFEKSHWVLSVVSYTTSSSKTCLNYPVSFLSSVIEDVNLILFSIRNTD